MTIKSDDFTAKVRSRVRVGENPGMSTRTALATERSTAVHCGENNEEAMKEYSEMSKYSPEENKKSYQQRRAPKNNQASDDHRQDEAESHKTSQDQLGRIDVPGGEVGFEVETSLRGSGSSNDEVDNGDTEAGRSVCSEGSGLDFPLELLSGSVRSTDFADFRATAQKARSLVASYKNAQNLSEDAIMSAFEQSLQDSQNLKRNNKALFVDVNAEPAPRTSDRKDETPVTNNRSQRNNEKTPNFSQSPPASMLSLKSKKKEGVANTLATVVQEIESPVERTRASLATTSTDADDDSSAEVDARWETLRSKYDQESQPPRPKSSHSYNEDLNEREMRDTLLDVNSGCPSPRINLSGSSFEDDLIQDCIETGLPSPDKQRRQHDEGLNFSDQPSHSSSKTTTHGNVSPKECTARDLLKAAKSGSKSSNFTDDERNDRKIALSRKQEIVAPLKKLSPKHENRSRESFVGHANEDFPLPKIEISLMPSESSASQTLSDISQSLCAEHGQYDEQSQGENSDLRPERGLSWWKKNGRSLVNEKLQKGSPNVKRNPLSSEIIEQGSQECSSYRDELYSKNSSSSISDCPSTGNADFESAFKRGMSIFGNRKSSVNHPISPPKATQQLEGSTKNPTPSQKAEPENNLSARVPHPNSDADSSIGVNDERRRKPPSGIVNTGAVVVKELISMPHRVDENYATSARHGRLARPGCEDSGAGGAIGLAPSPRGPTDIPVPEPTPATTTTTLPSYNRSEVNAPVGLDKRQPDAAVQAAIHRNEASAANSSVDLCRKKMIITGAKRFFEKKQDFLSTRSHADESEYAADILNVASTLTGETMTMQQPKSESKGISPTLAPPKSEINKPDIKSTVSTSGNKEIPSLGVSASAGVPSWRMLPAESLSDFEILAYCTKSGASASYHVHKHIVGVGPHRSEFLGGVFRSSADTTTKLALVDESLVYMPDILDFAYCHDLELDLTTANVMVYRYLAGVFQIIPIVKQAAEFIVQDIRIENMSTYISESSRYSDRTVTKMIAAMCGEQIEAIDVSDELWTVMDPRLFLRVISCPDIDRKKVSRQLSVLLVEYHTIHEYEMDVTMFLDMTTVSILPLVDREAAIPLLEICEDYGTPRSLQSLQKRCAQVVAHHWKTTSDADRRRLFSLLRSLPSNFTVDFLEVVETGNASALIDPAVSKALRDDTQRTAHLKGYKRANSFTVESLCGKIDKNRNHLKGDLDRPLSWKMDPGRSFSDWTMKVKHKNDGKLDVYHVHKHILSIGQYSSSFFADTFLSEDHKNSRKGSTMIELSQAPAELVPVVLDFMYSPEHHLIVTTTTASALRFLSRVFGMWMLNKKVVEYVEKDMDFSNLLIYLEQAEMYDDERITSIAVQKCATRITGIDAESEILAGIKPDFFGRIIASTEIDKDASCHINILIAKYFTLHDLDETLLAELMKQVPMKDVDLESALKLLDVMSSVKSKGVGIFAEIRQRCAELLISNWKTLRAKNRDMTFNIMRTLDAALVSKIFNVVENEYYNELVETMSVQSKLTKRYRAKLDDAETQRETQIAKIKEENELMVMELLERQQKLEAELANYEDATSRRALRSSGGFAHTRALSPGRSWSVVSPQSQIPRLQHTRAGMSPSPISNPENASLQKQTRTPRTLEAPTPPRRAPTVTAPCQQQGSLFGQWFGCRPENPSDEEQMDSSMTMAQTLPPAQFHHQQNLGA